MEDPQNQDICRVCRCEGTSERPLFHPCLCTGSIKFIHQDCLVQWLRYSRKEYCELCKHRFSFTPIYAPDMPKRLPIADILTGLVRSMGTAISYWFHYTLVAVAWLGVVPLTACRIYRCLFTGSVSSVFTLPLDLLSGDNVVVDIFHGFLVFFCTLSAFIALLWLREQILHGGPDWLERDAHNEEQNVNDGVVEADVQDNVADRAEPLHEPPAAVVAVGNNNNNGDVGEDINWNLVEWDGAGEELTWERLLGLDGSLAFLEYVFWIVSLNTMFILVFAFCPYHIGHFAILGLKLTDNVQSTQFEGLLTTLFGYFVVGSTFMILHALAGRINYAKLKRLLGVCYVVVKVVLLTVIEVGIFPLVGGWWLDICSLTLFDANLKDRVSAMKNAPGTFMFIHWLVGMVYVFYFATTILLLREVLRPGVLWFLRNLNDPDFNPIHEMIHLPVLRHARRFLASLVIFGTTVIFMVLIPIRFIHYSWSSFLPYHITLSSESPIIELALELMLLQVILPALLEHGHSRIWMKYVIQKWCATVSRVLGLRSYLLGDVPLVVRQEGDVVVDSGGVVGPDDAVDGDALDEGGNQNQLNKADNDGAAENANVEEVAENAATAEGFVQNVDNEDEQNIPPVLVPNRNVEQARQMAEPNERNQNAANRDVVEVADVVRNLGPFHQNAANRDVALGAAHQALLQRDGPTGFQPYIRPKFFVFRIVCLIVVLCVSIIVGSVIFLTVPVFIGRNIMSRVMDEIKIHELYTAGCGLYVCLVSIQFLTLIVKSFTLDWNHAAVKIKQWTVLGIKAILVVSIVVGIIPLMIGALVELVVRTPLRVPLHQTPIPFFWLDWALGILYTKIVCALIMLGPNWWLKNQLDLIYVQGFRNMDIDLVLRLTSLPVIHLLGHCLVVPYVISHSIAPFFVRADTLILVQRRIYPAVLAICLFGTLGVVQFVQFKRLYEHIKNDKYLVGKQLVNYNHMQVAPPLPEDGETTNEPPLEEAPAVVAL